jgi:hypothetical protein
MGELTTGYQQQQQHHERTHGDWGMPAGGEAGAETGVMQQQQQQQAQGVTYGSLCLHIESFGVKLLLSSMPLVSAVAACDVMETYKTASSLSAGRPHAPKQTACNQTIVASKAMQASGLEKPTVLPLRTYKRKFLSPNPR